MAVWKGAASVTTDTGGLLGATRFFAVSTANANPSGDQADWQDDAGTQQTIFFRTGTAGLSPPPAASTVVIQVRKADGTVLRELHNGAPPTNGQSFTFNLTSTGAAGGANNAGSLELYVRASTGGITPYDVDSQNTSGPGAITAFARGLYRSNALISNLAVSAYPAGSTFAYGAAAAENFTLTLSHIAPFTTIDGDVRIDATEGTAQQAAGTAKDYTGTSTTQQFTANNTFDDAAKTYGARALPVGNSFITPDSGAVLWSSFVDNKNGPTLVQDGDNVRADSLYAVDPRITTGVPIPAETVYNRGELAQIDISSITNARGEALTRSLSFLLADSGGTTQTTVSDTGPNYDVDYTIGAGDSAAATLTGDIWQVRTNQSDVDTQPFQNVYGVSSLYLVDVHPQNASILIKDDFPNEDDNESTQRVLLAGDIYIWVHVEGVRNDGTEIDTNGNAVTLEIRDPNGVLVDSFPLDTEADGWTTVVQYTPQTPAGDWTFTANVVFGGNSGTDTETFTFITPLTSNLFVVLVGTVMYKNGQSKEWRARTEIDNIAVDPQSLPVWKLYDETGAIITSGNTRNVANDTETISGAVYRVNTDDFGVISDGAYTLWVESQLNGNPMKSQHPFRVYKDKFDPVSSKLGAIGPP